MQLPQFIARALAFFDKAESNLKAEAGLAAARAQVTELEAALAGATADNAAAETNLTAARAGLAAATAKVTDLEAKLAAERGRANSVIANQGLPADVIPPADQAGQAQPKETAWSKYNRLMIENPRAAGEFYTLNAKAILDSRFSQ